MAEAQDLKHLLLDTNEEYRQLATKHHELDDRLHELASKHYLSDTEQFEEVTLKKRKLQLKDRMEHIARIYRIEHPGGRDGSPEFRRLESPAGSGGRGAQCPTPLFVCTDRTRNRSTTARRRGAPTRYDRKDMGIDRAGWPFILGAVVVAVLVGWWLGRWWAAPFLILAAFFLFFFRDPDRHDPERCPPRRFPG